MKTIFDVGNKVILKALINSIHVDEKNNIRYSLTVFDGEAGWNNQVNVSEKMLMKMNEMESEKE